MVRSCRRKQTGVVIDMYFDHGHMNDGWTITMMVVVMLGVWALLALGIVWMLRSTKIAHTERSGSVGSTTASGERILAERLAHGDIDDVEYESRLATLKSFVDVNSPNR